MNNLSKDIIRILTHHYPFEYWEIESIFQKLNSVDAVIKLCDYARGRHKTLPKAYEVINRSWLSSRDYTKSVQEIK